MAALNPNLRLLQDSAAARELDLASELFHRINRVIPESQRLLQVPPNCLARDAIRLMHEHWYSQVPVVGNGQVLGVFSYRSFAIVTAATSLNDLRRHNLAPGDLRVDDCMETFDFARVTDDMPSVFEAMDRDNAVLVGTPERLDGILTPMDFLRYLYRIASPFVLISEIELALRALIRVALSEDRIASIATRSLSSLYGVGKVPTILEDMSFDNYQALICDGDAWPTFASLFGGTPARTRGKLREIGRVRNDLFHFKREIGMQDHQTLADYRNWLLSKVKQAGHLRQSPSADV